MTRAELIQYQELRRFQIVEAEGANWQAKSAGSGFMIEADNHLFFVTADHIVNLHVHQGGITLRQDKITKVLVSTNVAQPDANGNLNTLMSQIGGFYYASGFNLNPQTLQLTGGNAIDAAVSMLPTDFLQKYTFCNSGIAVGNIVVPPLQLKQPTDWKTRTNPDANHTYSIIGKIKPQLKVENGIEILTFEKVYNEGMTFDHEQNGNYYFRYTKSVVYEDWGGLSGGPVFDNEGHLVGIQSGVIESGKISPNDPGFVVVRGLNEVRMYMGVAMLEEQNSNQ